MALLGCAYAGVLLIRPAALASIDTWVGLLLLVAAAFVGTCAGSVYLRLPFQPMAHVALDVWDFSTSWATNLTAVGALFGTVLAAALPLPKPHQSLLTKDAYTGLFLFFGAVLVVGTFFYYATRGLTGDEAAGGAARAARRHVPPPARVRVPPSPPLPADACERPALHRCPVSAA